MDAKSMGHEVTLSQDCADRAYLEGTLLRLTDQVARRLRGEGYLGRTVAIKLRNRRFETTIRQRALPEHTADCATILAVARALLDQYWHGEPLRLIGLTVSELEHRQGGEQAELFAAGTRARLLERALDQVRDRLGEASVVPLGSLTHRRTLGHVPFGPPAPRSRERPGSSRRALGSPR